MTEELVQELRNILCHLNNQPVFADYGTQAFAEYPEYKIVLTREGDRYTFTTWAGEKYNEFPTWLNSVPDIHISAKKIPSVIAKELERRLWPRIADAANTTRAAFEKAHKTAQVIEGHIQSLIRAGNGMVYSPGRHTGYGSETVVVSGREIKGTIVVSENRATIVLKYIPIQDALKIVELLKP